MDSSVLVCMRAYVGGCACLMCDLAFLFLTFTYDLRNEDDVDNSSCNSPIFGRVFCFYAK